MVVILFKSKDLSHILNSVMSQIYVQLGEQIRITVLPQNITKI